MYAHASLFRPTSGIFVFRSYQILNFSEGQREAPIYLCMAVNFYMGGTKRSGIVDGRVYYLEPSTLYADRGGCH